jgi:alpha,alpha-trehalase
MMIWRGLLNYGFTDELQELVYRWLFMITKNAVDYNGTIPEKYDVVAATHKVFAEYGNVGTDFEYITQEGFGWMNASYQYGLSLLEPTYIEKLDTVVNPDIIFD